jgi:hypothetical protein
LPSSDGGFGGEAGVARCRPLHTPILFIHGNTDNALGWDAPPAASVKGGRPAPRSVYDELRKRGYTDCELFGVSYLDAAERANPAGNYHSPAKFRMIIAAIKAVQAVTGRPQLDIVAHSLGVSMAIGALTWADSWGAVRRFVNIAGGLRGLEACELTGPANPLAPTCGSENLFDHWTFGFFPDGGGLGRNRWTGVGSRYSMRTVPQRATSTRFYTITAGTHDQIHCTIVSITAACASGPLFDPFANVRAQLDIGAGASAMPETAADRPPGDSHADGGDHDGVGHYGARNQAGEILAAMLMTECSGLACQGDYRGSPVHVAP